MHHVQEAIHDGGIHNEKNTHQGTVLPAGVSSGRTDASGGRSGAGAGASGVTAWRFPGFK